MSEPKAKTETPLRVIHVTLSIQRGFGGPARSVPALCQGLARHGCQVDLVSVDWGRAFGQPLPVDERALRVHVTKGFFWKHPRLWLTPGFGRFLRKVAAGAELIHSDSIWAGMSMATAAVARQLGIPEIISIRGQLAPSALHVAAWKKAIVRPLYADRNLRQAACLHATALHELAQVRAFGLTNPVAVIPNGIDLEPFDTLPPPDRAGREWREFAGKRLVLFIGRVHPIKGLNYLMQAWCHLARRFDDWHLVIAGPDEVGQQAQLERTLRKGGAAGSVTFIGPVYLQDKFNLLKTCDLLVLPSLSENFGTAVAEALAARKPVITTVNTPWEDVRTHQCGWVVEVGAEPLEAALDEALRMGEQQMAEMGQRGRKLVEEKYSWDRLAGQMVEVYRWLLRGGAPPACMHMPP